MTRIEPRLGFTMKSVDDLMSQLPNRYREKYEKGIGIAKPRVVQVPRNPEPNSRLNSIDGIPLETMIDAFGEPLSAKRPGDKMDYQWHLRMPSGNIISIWNYKNGPNYLGEDKIDPREIENWSTSAANEDYKTLLEILQHYPEDSPSYE